MGVPAKNIMISMPAPRDKELKAWRIAKVVEAVCKGVPWECKCLVQAVCTSMLLQHYHIPSAFYLGSKIDSNDTKKMKAHAWVTVGKYTIIGGEVADENYIVSATFTRPSLKEFI